MWLLRAPLPRRGFRGGGLLSAVPAIFEVRGHPIKALGEFDSWHGKPG
jgi:hypothetical protein